MAEGHISRVPVEVLGLIADFVPSRSDLISLLCVSKRFHASVEPTYLRSIEIQIVKRRSYSLTSFYEFIASPSDGKRRSRNVKSFSVIFLDQPTSRNLSIIDKVVPTLTCLSSLDIDLSYYARTMTLQFLLKPSPHLSLKRFKYYQRSSDPIGLDVFLNSQKLSITHVELWTLDMKQGHPHIPNLVSLSVNPEALFHTLARNSSVSHLQTMFDGIEGNLTKLPALDNLVTLSCSVRNDSSLCHLMSRAKNLKYLQITQVLYLDALLDSIQNASITHARFLIDSKEQRTSILQTVNSDLIPKSLRCVEVQEPPPYDRPRQPHSTRALRMIAEFAPDRSDLISLLRVSKKFHSLVEPIFLQIIELEVVNRRHPSLIPFYEFITSASHGQRRSRSVKSFSIVFLNPAEEAAPQDLNIIDEVVPKFKSLRSLQIGLSAYTGAMPLRLLRNPSPWFSLQRFSYNQRSLNHINLDIFLNTQNSSITHVESWTRGMSLPHIPNLVSLSIDPQALRQVAARNASISHLWTMLSGMEGDLSTLPALDNLVTLSCSVFSVPSLRHLMAHAKNLKHLQITQVRNLELLLDGIRDAHITHARFLLDSVEKGTSSRLPSARAKTAPP
ncbi:hypothetical protein ONZ45_g4328 [Pleurotus djamor]|nr:hypothetical protein ONZ45_g4328 [Pleurotus djamor]